MQAWYHVGLKWRILEPPDASRELTDPDDKQLEGINRR
jgi:hypothetical protein